MKEKTFNGKPVKVVANIVLELGTLRILPSNTVYGYHVWYTDHYITDHLLLESMFTRGGFVEGNCEFSDDGHYIIDEFSFILGNSVLNGQINVYNSKIKNLTMDQKKEYETTIRNSTVKNSVGSRLNILNSTIDGLYGMHSAIFDSCVDSICLEESGIFDSYISDATIENMAITSGTVVNCVIKPPCYISVTNISAINHFDYTEIIGIGSDGCDRCLFAYHDFDELIKIRCGCWTGTLQEFKERVKSVYREFDEPYLEYMKAIDFIEIKMNQRRNTSLLDKRKYYENFICKKRWEKEK